MSQGDPREAHGDREAYVRFLEAMDRVQGSIRGARSMEYMLDAVLGEVLDILNCDRAWLMFPCNPQASSWRVPTERTRPEYPGAFAKNEPMPMTEEMAAAFRLMLESPVPVIFHPRQGLPLPDSAREYSVQSSMNATLYPHVGDAWLWGVSQCSYAREWTAEEQRLFAEMGYRVADALSAVLSYQTLQRSEQRYRHLLEAMTDGVAMIDQDGVVLHANGQLGVLLGLSPAEIRGRRLAEFLVEQESSPLREGESQLTYWRRADGGRSVALLSLRPVWSGSGTREGSLVIATDYSERQETQAKLDRLVQIVEATSDMVATATIDGHVSYINPAGAQMLGIDATSELGRIADAHPERSYEVVREEGLPAAKRDGLWRGETTLLARDGREIPTSQVIMAHRAANNEVEYFSTIARDMSEVVRTQRELERIKTLLEAVIAQSPLAVIIAGPDGTLSHINAACYDQLGMSPNGPFRPGCQLHELKPNWQDFDREGNQLSLEELPLSRALRGEFTAGQELRVVRHDGTERWEIAQGVPVRDSGGALVAAVSFYFDVTNLKSTERELFHAQKMEAIGRLAGGVAHDFINMLTGILGYAELILSDLSPDDSVHRDVRDIHRAAERASVLTTQLLAFSRKQLISPEVVQLDSVLDSSEKMLRRIIGEDIAVVVKPAVNLWPVCADVGQVDQVLVNLAVNGRDAMPSGGVLSVELCNTTLDEEYVRSHVTARAGDYVVLTVRDTGCGIPPEIQERVFDPFFTTKPPGQGTGLGLSTVYGIMQQNGGFVRILSEVGVGTTVKAYFPRTESASRPRTESELARPTGEGQLILLVEDEEMVRKFTQRTLERAGYRLLTAANGEEALALSDQHDGPIHLLLTDVVMPLMNGPELYEKLHKRRPAIQVAYMSGYADDVVARHGTLTNGSRFLHKPFKIDALLRLVRTALDESAPASP